MVTFDWPPFEGTDLSAVVASGRMASTNNAFATVPVVLASGYCARVLVQQVSPCAGPQPRQCVTPPLSMVAGVWRPHTLVVKSVCTVIRLPFKALCGLTVWWKRWGGLRLLRGHLFTTNCVFLYLMVISTPSTDDFPAPKDWNAVCEYHLLLCCGGAQYTQPIVQCCRISAYRGRACPGE